MSFHVFLIFWSFSAGSHHQGMNSPSPHRQPHDSRSPRDFPGGGMNHNSSPGLVTNQGKTHPGLKVVIPPSSSRQVWNCNFTYFQFFIMNSWKSQSHLLLSIKMLMHQWFSLFEIPYLVNHIFLSKHFLDCWTSHVPYSSDIVHLLGLCLI